MRCIATKVQNFWFISLINIQLKGVQQRRGQGGNSAFSDGIIFEQQIDFHFWWKICVRDITLNFAVVTKLKLESGTFSNLGTLVEVFFVAIFILEI